MNKVSSISGIYSERGGNLGSLSVCVEKRRSEPTAVEILIVRTGGKEELVEIVHRCVVDLRESRKVLQGQVIQIHGECGFQAKSIKEMIMEDRDKEGENNSLDLKIRVKEFWYPQCEADLLDSTSDEKIMFISDFIFTEEEDGINCFNSVINRKTGMKKTKQFVMVDNIQQKFPIVDELLNQEKVNIVLEPERKYKWFNPSQRRVDSSKGGMLSLNEELEQMPSAEDYLFFDQEGVSSEANKQSSSRVDKRDDEEQMSSSDDYLFNHVETNQQQQE